MGTDKKWLVKSSDAIQGPLEFDVVVENIFTGDIHLLDEIKGPFERWRPIKDHSLFAAAIEKLKATTYSQRENTVTATVDLGTKTHELTRSETVSITNKLEPSATPTDSSSQISSRQEGTEGTVVYQPAVAGTYGGEASPETVNPKAKTWVPPQGVPGRQRASSRRFPTAFIFSFLLIVFMGVAYLMVEFNQSRLIEQKVSAYDQMTNIAVESLRVGEYRKALRNFTQAFNISPKDPNLVLEMAPLTIQFDGQFEQTQAMLESLLLSNKQKQINKLARNSIGLSYSYRGQFNESLASYNQALSLDPNYLPSLLNKGFALLKLQRYEEAMQLMREVVGDYPEDPMAHYLYIRSLAEKGIADNDEAALKEALSVSGNFATEFFDFRQEVMFLIAMVNEKLGVSGDDLQQYVNNVMRIDLELTKLHVHSAHVDFQSFNWLDFFNYCKILGQPLQEYNQKLLQGFCFLKVNRPLDAKKIFEELLSQNSNDGILQALYASTSLMLNDVSQAKNALGFINQIELKQPVVETILRGCLSAGDLSCGEAIFKGQHAKHLSPLYFRWGESEVSMEKDRKKAKRSIALGLQNSPGFAPLMKLQKKIGQ
jgi:tetratricopeptide (TPR) repeat protein